VTYFRTRSYIMKRTGHSLRLTLSAADIAGGKEPV